MVFNVKEWGEIEGNVNLKANIFRTVYDRSKTTGELGMVQILVYPDNKRCKMYTWNEIQGCHGKKTAFNKKTLFISKWDLNLRKKAVKCYGAYHFCGAANWTHRRVNKFRQNFEMWSWRRMEISWTCFVKNEDVLQKVKEERNILLAWKRRRAKWIAHILRGNCLIKHIL